MPGQLVLLATGPAGYRSLCRLSSLLQGSPERAAVIARGLGWDDLHAHRHGLICLSGGRRGWIERYLRAGDHVIAQLYAGRLAGIFDENACLALEIHHPDDQAVAAEVVALGQRLGLPAAVVQPVYCLAPEEDQKLRLLAAIERNCRLEELPQGLSFQDLHWLSPAELAARFAPFPQAVSMAGALAARCGPALPDGRPIWPGLKLPEGQTPDQVLTALAENGLRQKYGPHPTAEVRDRLASELATIARRGYAPLFLVVADIVRYARQAAIPVSTRGSVANSLAAYCADITTVDPVEHELLFERFLNPARGDTPDMDLDFCSRRRDEVLAYVRDTYGPEHVALVGTVSTMRPQAAVRETAKACGLAEEQIDHLAKLMPHDWHPDPRRRSKRTADDVVAALDDPRLREIVRAAYILVGQPDHLSVHPGGVVITPGPLTDVVPVQWTPKGFLITQFGHADLEALGLVKIDLLGIRALTVLADTAELVRRHHDAAFCLEAIPLDDPLTGDLLELGETIGVFQCESEGAQRTLRKLQARTVADLAIANAFFKPGPSTGGMAQAFVRRYRGEEPVTYLHPALAPILGRTKGVLIFQEQILRVAREVAGLSWAQADHLRRGMSKFRAEEMAELREQFLAGCQRPAPVGSGFTPAQAQRLWEQVLAFAGYGFNQGHATAYADVSYRCAYLKAHYPAAFLCARLADYGGFHHPAIYMAEAARLGIAVRPPHVNHSAAQFTLATDAGRPQTAHSRPQVGEQALIAESNPAAADHAPGTILQPSATLWMGLAAVRDLRRSAIRAIIAERERRPFDSLRDLVKRVELQPREVVHLIQCGAADGLGDPAVTGTWSRAAMLAEVEGIRRAGSALQMAFSFAGPQVPPETPAQRLAWEQHLLGLPISVHPLALVADRLPAHLALRRLPEVPGQPVIVAGVRLPGWTGGPGFFLGDGDTFVIVKGGKGTQAPPTWRPLLLRGRWTGDGYGTFWFQAEQISEIEPWKLQGDQ
jgi:DNA-directed DNA polymerase III PolC